MTIKDYADNMVKLLPEHYHGKIEITIVDSNVSAIHNTRSEKYGQKPQDSAYKKIYVSPLTKQVVTDGSDIGQSSQTERDVYGG